MIAKIAAKLLTIHTVALLEAISTIQDLRHFPLQASQHRRLQHPQIVV
jgi:hypothetical protein